MTFWMLMFTPDLLTGVTSKSSLINQLNQLRFAVWLWSLLPLDKYWKANHLKAAPSICGSNLACFTDLIWPMFSHTLILSFSQNSFVALPKHESIFWNESKQEIIYCKAVLFSWNISIMSWAKVSNLTPWIQYRLIPQSPFQPRE